MKTFDQKYICITGASSGIGKEILRVFIERGAGHIAVVGRRPEPLNELREIWTDVDFLVIPGDIGKPGDVDRMAKIIEDKWGRLDILVNNAGVVSAALLDEMNDEDIISQININLTGLILLTKKCLPLLKESTDAGLINVSSGLGLIARPFYNVYSVTKAGVRQFSEAMRRELKDSPIHVMTVYPTATDTPMMKNADVKKSMDDPYDVAQRSVDGFINGEIDVIFGGEKRVEDARKNFLHPRQMDEEIAAQFEALRERTSNHRAM
jgi:short-subunit dehydrogenase